MSAPWCHVQVKTGRAVVAARRIVVEGLSWVAVHQLKHATRVLFR
jgi:hypothetical protein